MSSLSYFFDTTVTELGKDLMDEKCDKSLEVDSSFELRQSGDRPHSHDWAGVSGSQIEMGPIRPVSGGPIVRDVPMFSPEESELLESVIQVSPAIVDESLGETVRMDV